MKRTFILFIIVSLSAVFGFSQKKTLIEDKLLIVLDIQEYYTNSKLIEDSSQKLIDSINYVISKTNPNNVIG
jgi:hypothetical protein